MNLEHSSPSHAVSDAAEVNREYYDSLWAGQEDYWNRMAAPRSRVATLCRLLAEKDSASVVDLGCGNGRLLREVRLRNPGAVLAGIDQSMPQVDLNRVRMPEIVWHAIDLGRPDAIPEDLRGRFQAVIASEIIEHLPDPETFLRNACSLAKPGTGRLLLSTQSGPLRETERLVGHVKHFHRHEMETLLEGSGWQVVRVWNCGFPFHDLSKWWANRNPSAIMERFGGRAYGPYEKLVCFLLRIAFRLNSRRRGAQLFALARRREA
jgi:2-polyprenyl-3-methyl-5-hydroxy-6-metoxy-1,4-benzoquinol methylase